LETFTKTKELIENPHFSAQREKCLCSLSDNMIDVPILEIIRGFNKLPAGILLAELLSFS